MSQPVFPDKHTTSMYQSFPHPQFITRTRRETNPIDTINARQFEHWQTDSKYGVYARPDMNKQPQFYDMMPNMSRKTQENYRSQERMDSSLNKGIENPYFNKYDAQSDSRNMIRELKASVYEDKHFEYNKESEKISQRNMENKWLPPLSKLDAIEQLRPKFDDIRIFYQ